MKQNSLLVFACAILATAAQASNGTPHLTYLFNNNLSAVEGGAPSLSIVGPPANTSYGSINLYGGTRSYISLAGAIGANNNVGLSLATQGWVPPTTYTFEAVFSMDQRFGSYRKILDVSARTNDGGLYYYPGNQLGAYPNANGTTVIANGTTNYVAVTVNSGTIKGYVNGNLEFTVVATTLDANGAANNLMNFFVDDSATGYNEYSSSKVSLLRLTDRALTGSEISDLAVNPFGSVPEPAPYSLLAFGLLGLLRRRKG